MTALGYFPELLPDELLYSAIARLGRHRGITVDSVLTAELFGRRHAVAAFDLPGNLSTLAARLDPQLGLDVDTLIDNTTLFPFYAAFVSAKVKSSVRASMAGSVQGAHTRLGVAAFRVPPLRALRWCPLCVEVMDDRFGERYWRRAHHLSGIPVCPEHGIMLIESSAELGGLNRHRFMSADAAIDLNDHRVGAHRAVSEKLLELAASAVSLFASGNQVVGTSDRADDYRDRLAAVGLMASRAMVDQQELEAAFLRHWGGALASIPGILVNGQLRGDWLAAMVRHRPRGAHPVCHLLLQLFLEAQADRVGPFGSGPWTCRNPIAAHHGHDVVADLVVRRDRAVHYGDFRCGCGYVYTRRADAGGVIGAPRFRSFGPDFAPALRDFISRGCGLRETARSCGVDPKTLVREAVSAGVLIPWLLKPSGKIRTFDEGRRRRPVTPRPISCIRRGGKSRDWTLVDRRLAKSTIVHAAAILKENPPVRLTFGELERRVARQGWIMKRRMKLPRTAQCMSSLVEGLDAFRARRLQWAMSATFSDTTTTPSDILRLAGLPMSWMQTVRAALGGGSDREAEATLHAA